MGAMRNPQRNNCLVYSLAAATARMVESIDPLSQFDPLRCVPDAALVRPGIAIAPHRRSGRDWLWNENLKLRCLRSRRRTRILDVTDVAQDDVLPTA